MLSVNLKVPEQMNEQRKQLDVTWRDVLIAGLKALQSAKADPITIAKMELKALIRPHLVQAYESIKKANEHFREEA
jgi:hypothetical protein